MPANRQLARAHEIADGTSVLPPLTIIQARYATADVDGFEISWREAGDRSRPTLLLLHGSPTFSRVFSDPIPLLADRFIIVALALPGCLSRLQAANDRRQGQLTAIVGRESACAAARIS